MTESFKRNLTIEEFSHPISASVGPFFGFIGSNIVVAGTAVFIAPGLALTARHVLDEICGQLGVDLKGKEASLDMYVFQPGTGACWYVCSVAAWIGSDIAVLSLKARNDEAKAIRTESLALSADPPEVDDEVSGLGYPATKIAIAQNDKDLLRMKMEISPSISAGRVIDVHRTHRDSVMLPFPCFLVNAEFSGGMSGGAVFNADRMLCGLVCSGGEGELKDRSYATSLWVLALIPVLVPDDAPAIDGVVPGHTYKFLELARAGYVQLIGHERISFFIHENGTDGVSLQRLPQKK